MFVAPLVRGNVADKVVVAALSSGVDYFLQIGDGATIFAAQWNLDFLFVYYYLTDKISSLRTGK